MTTLQASMLPALQPAALDDLASLTGKCRKYKRSPSAALTVGCLQVSPAKDAVEETTSVERDAWIAADQSAWDFIFADPRAAFPPQAQVLAPERAHTLNAEYGYGILTPAAQDLLASLEASSFQFPSPSAHGRLTLSTYELLTSLEASSLQTLNPAAATREFMASLINSLLNALSPAAHRLLEVVVNEITKPDPPIHLELCHFCASPNHRGGDCKALCSYCKGRACPRAFDITLPCTSSWMTCPDYKTNPIANAVGGVFGKYQTNKQATAWRLVTYDRAHASRIYGYDISSKRISKGARVTLLTARHAEITLGGVSDAIQTETTNLIANSIGGESTIKRAWYNAPRDPRSVLGGVIDAKTPDPAYANVDQGRHDPVPLQFDPKNHSLPLAMQALGRRSTACEEADAVHDAVNAQWDAYNRFSQPERDEVLLIATKLEATSVFMMSSIYKAVAPFIRFAPVANRDVWALLRQDLAEFDRGIHVFGGSIDGHHNDTVLCVFSPDDEEALKIMKKRIKLVIKRLSEGLAWGHSIIEDTLLYGTPHSDAGVPIDAAQWQPAINAAFDDSRERLIDCYVAIRFFYGNLRYSKLLLVQEVMRDEQLQTVEHIFDQEVPPDDYESDNESDEKHKTG